MQKNYNKAYKEVVEILKYVPKEDVEKIPIQMLEMFEEKMDKSYEFNYDENKNFEEQELLIETKAIFANIFRDYWATLEQKERIIAKQNHDRKKEEEQKKEKYNTDNMFKKENDEQATKVENSIIVYKEPLFRRMINKIKKIFKNYTKNG